MYSNNLQKEILTCLVHLYFLASPFCAPDSNNKVLELHAQSDEQSRLIIGDRHAFEDRLRTMTGIEYMVMDGPDPLKLETHGNPVWVIRKHRREKEHGYPDKVTILGTYYAIGDTPYCNIYQAPSVYDILKNGLDLVTLQLKEFFDMAYKMQRFSPADGYSYIKPDSKKAVTAGVSRSSSLVGTPEPDAASQQPDHGDKGEEDGQAASDDDALLWESLQKAIMYQDEYMDENPLQGEPGSFFFKSTQEHVRTRNKKAQEAAAEASKQASSRTSSVGSTPQLPPIKTEGLPRKGSKNMSPLSSSAKAKRRKSKAPTSPSAPKSPP